MKTIAVIPARGGSKRIPGKNIIDFMGKPMLAWTINAALESQLFDRIIVSTDNVEIAETAAKYGLEVPFMRQKDFDDSTPVSLASISAVRQAQEYWKEEYDVVIQLMANCPLRGKKEINESYNHFISKDAKFQLSCFKFGWMNPWWAFKLSSSMRPNYVFEGAIGKRSQDLDQLYCPTGAVWIAKVQQLLKENTFYGVNHVFYPIDWKAAVDIDTYEDLEFAKIVFNLK